MFAGWELLIEFLIRWSRAGPCRGELYASLEVQMGFWDDLKNVRIAVEILIPFVKV